MQVQELGGMRTMGLPLACNAVRHRIKLVTDSYVLYKSIQKMSAMHTGTLAALIVQIMSLIIRVVTSCCAGDSLTREVRDEI